MKNQYQLSFEERDTAIVVPAGKKNKEKRLHAKSPNNQIRCGKSTSCACFCLFCIDAKCNLTLHKKYGSGITKNIFCQSGWEL